MRDERPARNMLVIAVGAMLAQQSFASMAQLVVPVAAPVLSDALGLEPALIGVYTSILFAMSMLGALSSGLFIQRYGGLRVSQVSLLAIALALILAAFETGHMVLFAISPAVLGLGMSVSTPASSQILSRYAPPRLAPVVFSIKQTGVPVGGMLAGILVPLFIVHLDWRGALAATGLMCLVLALGLQPLRREFDQDRDPEQNLALGELGRTLRQVTGLAALRELALATFVFVGLQAIFGAFFVTYLVKGLGHPLQTAGSILSASLAAAIGARILWGWVASRYVAPKVVLGLLGLVMAAASVGLALITPAWSLAAIGATAVLFTSTAMSWHGVLLAEVARLAPEGRVGAATGGVLFFTSAGLMVYPAVFGIILALTGSYGLGFALACLPALAVGIRFLRRSARG
ncbi:MAG TPA: MFS transporter [Alphaproteobacteria bacterium]|nr:MFS transporter [Alphaproteobacteria bacterium]